MGRDPGGGTEIFIVLGVRWFFLRSLYLIIPNVIHHKAELFFFSVVPTISL